MDAQEVEVQQVVEEDHKQQHASGRPEGRVRCSPATHQAVPAEAGTVATGVTGRIRPSRRTDALSPGQLASGRPEGRVRCPDFPSQEQYQ